MEFEFYRNPVGTHRMCPLMILLCGRIRCVPTGKTTFFVVDFVVMGKICVFLQKIEKCPTFSHKGNHHVLNGIIIQVPTILSLFAPKTRNCILETSSMVK